MEHYFANLFRGAVKWNFKGSSGLLRQTLLVFRISEKHLMYLKERRGCLKSLHGERRRFFKGIKDLYLDS